MAFKYRYLDKLEIEETAVMSKGTTFHEWSESLEQQLKLLKDDKTIKTYLEALAANPERSDWETYYINFLLELLSRCLAEKKEKWRDYFHPFALEQKYQIDIGGNFYTCICDRIYKSFDDKYILTEIKTGSAVMEDVRKELCISKFIVEAVAKINIAYFGIINPNLKIAQTEKVKKVSMTYMRKSLDKFVAAVNSGVFTKNDYLCGTCSFAKNCYNFTFFR